MELYIGNTLKKLRLTTGLTQEEVATQLGISPQSISKWERGDGYPDITMLPALANYFCITVDELIGMDKINACFVFLQGRRIHFAANFFNGIVFHFISTMTEFVYSPSLIGLYCICSAVF